MPMPHNHAISFFSTDVLTLNFWNGEELDSLTLEGDMKIEFEGRKNCVGFKSRNNRYKCPYKYEGRIQCPFCGSRDISRIYTRHDFKGYEDLEEEFSQKEFSIYIVSFGDRIKCGVTQAERIKDRVKEQGADYYAELMRLKGPEAYEMERLLQSQFGFKNSVQSRTKLKLLGNPRPDLLEQAIVEVESAAPFNEYLLDAPMPQKLEYAIPEKFSIADNIDGKIICAKGPLVFFENSQGAHVLNIKSKEGTFFNLRD